MKVIDLLNKIANGEYPIIKEGINKYEYNSAENDYITGMGYNYEHYFSNIGNILEYLNDEIEIIEEPKKIEKIDGEFSVVDYKNGIGTKWSNNEMILIDKLNEIIDYINKGDNKE